MAEYQIENIGFSYPAQSNHYTFHGTEVVTTHKNSAELYKNPWGHQMAVADIMIEVDGEMKEILEGYAVKIGDEKLNQYADHVSYLLVKERGGSEKFILLLKMSKQHVTENARGDHIGYVPDQDLLFRTYTINREREVTKEDFTFTERDGFQTQLLNRVALYQHQIGYFTDAWKGWPVYYFPFIYPFATFILGIVLLIKQVPFRFKNNSMKKEF